MNQINENLTVLQVGDPYNDSFENYLKIYLSGSLDISGAKLTWQEKFINGLGKLTTPHPDHPEIPDYSMYKFLVMNPLMPVAGNPDLNNQQFVQKVQWELGMMGSADVIFCNFLKKSTSISAIQGFLLWAQSGKVICRCPIESMFYPQIKLMTGYYRIPLVGNTGSVINVLETMFQNIQKFSDLRNYNIS